MRSLRVTSLSTIARLKIICSPILPFRSIPTAAARGAPRHDQRSLSGVYDAYVLERCSSESEDTTIDILERCISQPEISMWRCVKSSRENGDDESELGCGIRPKMNVSDRIFGCFGNTPELATVTPLRSLLRRTEWRPLCELLNEVPPRGAQKMNVSGRNFGRLCYGTCNTSSLKGDFDPK